MAAGDTFTCTAAPLATVRRGDDGPDWAAIDHLLREYGPTMLVVGFPYNEDGSHGTLAGAASDFAEALTQRSGVPVARVDERYSSLEASAELRQRREAGTRRRRVARGDVDSLAAAIILERWLRDASGALR